MALVKSPKFELIKIMCFSERIANKIKINTLYESEENVGIIVQLKDSN